VAQAGMQATGLVDSLYADLQARLVDLDRELESVRRELQERRVEAAEGRVTDRAGKGHPTRTVTLWLAEGGRPTALSLTYAVAAARWWPAYSVRLTDRGRRAELTREAFLAQATFEDWSSVRLALCTADLARDVRLPELASLRIGRAQPPARRGFREPPQGLDALFRGYDDILETIRRQAEEAAREAAAVPALEPSGQTRSVRLAEAREEAARAEPKAEAERMMGWGGMPSTQAAMADGVALQEPMPEAMPRRSKGKGLLRAAAAAVAAPVAAGAAVASMARRQTKGAPAPPPPAGPSQGQPPGGEAGLDVGDEWLDFDRLVLGDPAAAPPQRRGRLKPRPPESLPDSVQGERERIERLEAPAGTQDPGESAGQYDYRFEADGEVDVLANGRLHRLVLGGAAARAEPAFRCVPGTMPSVFREVTLENPFDGPLLPGPLDVFYDGALMTSDRIDSVDRGGTLRFGLGVEDRLRVARNVRVRESSHGLLGGKTHVDHRVEIEISSALGHAVSLEVLERIPIPEDEDGDIEVALVDAEPLPQAYDQKERGEPVKGGRRFVVEVPPGGTVEIRYDYRIELPAKEELVGGNRRD
jgi:hypothetical protein